VFTTAWILSLRRFGSDVGAFTLVLDTAVGGAVAGAFIGYNVAEVKQSRAETETERRRRASLFQNSLSAMVDLEFHDDDPVVRDANEEFRDLFAFESADVAGERLFELTSPDDEETARAMAAHLRREEIYTAEVTRPTNDGVKDFRLRLVPYSVRDEDQRAYAIYIDITPFKEAERLERSNERLQEFAYIASHDLQEPLRMVSSYLGLLEAEYADELDAEADEYIEYAVDGAERMQQMVNALLTYSRVETEADPLEPTDASGVVESVLRDLELLVAETDAEVTVETLPTVMADRNQLGQLFQNLLKNAIQHAGESPPSVNVSATDVGEYYRFEVTDDGEGIPESKQDEIFRIFEGSDDPGGTGIGLAICRRIVGRHDGEIWVESEQGAGTTVYFTLPKATAAQTTPTQQ
jgi:chemotaxis family two-component system sensor kinase Cph1